MDPIKTEVILVDMAPAECPVALAFQGARHAADGTDGRSRSPG